MTTDRKYTPVSAPEQYREATLQDILNPKIDGFYDETGAYWRKNGKVKTWKTRPTHAKVPVKFGLRDYCYIDHENVHLVYVRLSYI